MNTQLAIDIEEIKRAQAKVAVTVDAVREHWRRMAALTPEDHDRILLDGEIWTAEMEEAIRRLPRKVGLLERLTSPFLLLGLTTFLWGLRKFVREPLERRAAK